MTKNQANVGDEVSILGIRSRNLNPFAGWELHGTLVHVFEAGKVPDTTWWMKAHNYDARRYARPRVAAFDQWLVKLDSGDHVLVMMDPNTFTGWSEVGRS